MPRTTAPWPRGPRRDPTARVTPQRTTNGKLRWLTTLAPEADAVFAASVAAVTPTIERRLGPEVLADRSLPGTNAGIIRLAPWEPARLRWRRQASRGLGGARAVVVADVRDCFGSIGAASVVRSLAQAGAPSSAIDRVTECLRMFAEDGVRGLPIGPVASAVLANAVLATLDDAVRGRGVPHLRWVDDVVAFGGSPRAAGQALDALRAAAADIGLALHDEKTRIVDDPWEARALLGAPNSPGAAAGMA
jgi:hypothetical protein